MSSSINENIILNIKRGQGLSQAIDEQLDKELNTNVKLGLSEWQSVFNLVKQNQVTENKSQFGEKDSDIRNRNSYIVGAGTYQITKNVWNEILNIAKKSLGIATDEKEPDKVVQSLGSAVTDSELKMDVKTPTLTTPNLKQEIAEQEQTTQQIVNQLLENAGINTEGLDINDIAGKYDAIKNTTPDISDEKLNERIANYAKALKAHQTEAVFAEAWAQNETTNTNIEITGVKDAIIEGNMEKFKAAFHQAAKEYIELYDNAEGDGKINIEELLAMEEKELGRKLTDEERKIALNEAINRMAILDKNDDNKLDETEIAAYIWAMSKINDDKNGKTADNITFEEWKTSQEAIGAVDAIDADFMQGQQEIIEEAKNILSSKGKTLADLNTINNYEDLNLTDEEKQILDATKPLLNYAIFAQTLENGYNGLK